MGSALAVTGDVVVGQESCSNAMSVGIVESDVTLQLKLSRVKPSSLQGQDDGLRNMGSFKNEVWVPFTKAVTELSGHRKCAPTGA